MGFQRVKEYISHPYEHPLEGKLVRKLDFFILTFCCLMYFTNYLDRSNLANAYVSGMKEDLAFVGNQYNVINTVFTIGYIIGQIPSNLALHHFQPRLFFPTMILIWAALTMLTSTARRPRDIMAIRFFQGLAESSTFVGTHYILGSWYTRRELGKRSGIFTSAGLAGTMFGGFLQTGIHARLDGKRGLSGWKWLFIIDGLITLPIAGYGFWLFPDTPRRTTAFYLSGEDRDLAIARLAESSHHEKEEGENREKTWRLSFMKKVWSSSYWYGFVILWILAGETESFSSNSLLALYMKSTKRYTISQLNNYPTGIPAVGILSTLFFATLTDFFNGKRYIVAYFISITGIVTSAMVLTAFDNGKEEGKEDVSVIFAAYYWAGSVYACQATFFAWANDALRGEEGNGLLRAVVIAGMNCGSNAVNAWWSILFYSADMAPRFVKGMWAMIGTCIALAIWTTGLLVLIRRVEKERVGVREREGSVRVEDVGRDIKV